MDYNTHRQKMRMPEYGRSVHLMVEHCKQLPDRAARQAGAEKIVETMKNLHPDITLHPDYKQRLWDHLAIMANFELDIDYPYAITSAEKLEQRPQSVVIKKHRIPVRHYGNLVFETLNHICTMENGPKRDELVRLVANQMKRDLIMYGNSGPDNERIISDIAQFTDGKIQIDPQKFKFDYIVTERKQPANDKDKKKKRK